MIDKAENGPLEFMSIKLLFKAGEIEITPDEARRLLGSLKDIFEEKQVIQDTYTLYPLQPEYKSVDFWSYEASYTNHT